MRFMLNGGQENKLPDAMVLPTRQEFIQRSMKGFSTNPGRSGVALLAWRADSVVEAWRQEKSTASGDFLTYGFRDNRVGAQGEVRSVLDQSTNRHHQSWIPGEDSPDLGPGKGGKGE